MQLKDHTVKCPAAFGRAFTLLSAFLLLAACAGPQVLLERVLVRNATSGTITDVEVRHAQTLRFGAVNSILSGSAYELGLAKQPLTSKDAMVSWRDDAGQPWAVKLALPRETGTVPEGQALSLVYVIGPSGLATVSLQP